MTACVVVADWVDFSSQVHRMGVAEHLGHALVNLKKRAETVWFSAFLNYPKEIILKEAKGQEQ